MPGLLTGEGETRAARASFEKRKFPSNRMIRKLMAPFCHSWIGNMENNRELQSHHYAWLSKHPERSEQWLRDKLNDGFEVYSVDGILTLVWRDDYVKCSRGSA